MDERFTSERFINDINKIHKLFENGIYSTIEYSDRKTSLIQELVSKGIKQPIDDFISEILVLKTNNILEQKDILAINKQLRNFEMVNMPIQKNYTDAQVTNRNSRENVYVSKPKQKKSIIEKILITFFAIVGLFLFIGFIGVLVTLIKVNSKKEEYTNNYHYVNEDSLRTVDIRKKGTWSASELSRKFYRKSAYELESEIGEPTKKKQLNPGLDNYSYYYEKVLYDGKYILYTEFWVNHGTVIEAK
ncbi:MAG: hypothetical protein ACOYN6_00300 [Ignavibacteria bacterium]